MSDEEKNRLRKDSTRLLSCKDISATKDMVNILSECLFKLFNEQSKTTLKNRAESDARIVAQMIFTKTINLNKMMDGFGFTSMDNIKLNKIIDPIIIAVLVRNIFETVGMFNLVYVNPKNEDEKIIHYNLWVIAGLKFRQRFANKITSPENVLKQQQEEATIADMTEVIYNSEVFKNLDESGKKTILNKIKEKDYKVKIDDNKVLPLSWQDLIPLMGIDENLMGDMYTYFSLYSHPSNVSVFQFSDLFMKSDPHFFRMTTFNVLNAIKLICCFISDYIKVFPDTLDSFNKLPLIYQIAINYHCSFLKKDKSTINDALSSLN